MADIDRARIIRGLVIGLVIVLVIAGISYVVFRMPNVSNALKKTILPELERVTGRTVVARKVYANVIPPFIEARDVKMFGSDGTRILAARRVKGYIGIPDLFRGRITIRRLVVTDPEIEVTREAAEEIRRTVEQRAGESMPGRPAFEVDVQAVEMRNWSLVFSDSKTGTRIDIRKLNGEIRLGDAKKARVFADQVRVERKDWPVLEGRVTLNASLKGQAAVIDKLIVGVKGSSLEASGDYGRDGGRFSTLIQLLPDSVREVFNLRRSGEGSLTAEGDLEVREGDVSVDLSVSGGFYLETLMELLSVEERVEGFVEVKGRISGPIMDPEGSGRATMTNGNLFDVAIDTVTCTVTYADGTMSFREGEGKLYGGRARASSTITLPYVDYFTLDIEADDVDSDPLFGLLGWHPGVPNGKVRGTLIHAGRDFSPGGWFEYRNERMGEDALGRVTWMSGKYAFADPVLRLDDITVKSALSSLSGSGDVNIEKESLDMTARLETQDIRDLSGPYYSGFLGAGFFDGTVTGTFDDPSIAGTVRVMQPVLEGYASDRLDAVIDYRKDRFLLDTFELTDGEETVDVGGGIVFHGAEDIFDFRDPGYDLKVSFHNADFEKISDRAFAGVKVPGILDADLTVAGGDERPFIRGEVSVRDGRILDETFDRAIVPVEYAAGRLSIGEGKIVKGTTELRGHAVIEENGEFSFAASSAELNLEDFLERDFEGEAVFRIEARGSGTLNDPRITVDASMIRGNLRGKPLGAWVLKASVENRNVALSASMMEGNLSVTGTARLEENYPWQARMDIKSGRYDFFVASFLREVPEDLIVSLEGNVELRGDRNTISGASHFRHLIVSMYGYSFTSEDDIRIGLNDRRLEFTPISMRSGNTILRVSGSMDIGRSFDVVIEGMSELEPFKSVTKRIGHLKGRTDLVLSITGEWDAPRINGGLSLSDGAFGFKDFYHRITALNGYIYFDNDRVVLDKLTGKIGGGDVDISGILYLKRFAFRQFYVNAKMSNVTGTVSPDFTLKFGADLLYKGTLEEQLISGNIDIGRARYRERIDWKTWLLRKKRAEAPRTDTSYLEKVRLNVKVTGGESILIDNNIARATMSADLLLRGTLFRPVLLGRLEASRGTVYFRNNEFRIVHANADFADPNSINPIMDISAETVVQGYKIRLALEGQVEKFDLALASDPPLNDNDIFALLTTGRTSGEIQSMGVEGGIGAGTATSFLTGQIQDVIEERLTMVTGLDRLIIDPYVSKTSGMVEPRVTASKRLLADKVFLTYQTSLGEIEEQIIKVEYLVGKNMSLVGLRDERGILGADVRFRFEFK